MAEHNTEAHETAFTVSVDAAARFGVTTGHLRRRSRRHDSRGDRSRHGAAGPAPSRPRLPAARPPRRRAAARGPDRGERGPGAARRALSRRRDLRDPESRRHHGAAPAAGAVRRRARAHLHHDRPARGLPAGARAAGASRSPRRGCRRRYGEFRDHRLLATTWTRPSTWRWCTATCAASRACWCGCTRSVSPATCSARGAATAAGSCRARCGRSRPRAAASWSTSTRKGGASACSTSSRRTSCRTPAPTR